MTDIKVLSFKPVLDGYRVYRVAIGRYSLDVTNNK